MSFATAVRKKCVYTRNNSHTICGKIYIYIYHRKRLTNGEHKKKNTKMRPFWKRRERYINKYNVSRAHVVCSKSSPDKCIMKGCAPPSRMAYRRNIRSCARRQRWRLAPLTNKGNVMKTLSVSFLPSADSGERKTHTWRRQPRAPNQRTKYSNTKEK